MNLITTILLFVQLLFSPPLLYLSQELETKTKTFREHPQRVTLEKQEQEQQEGQEEQHREL